MSTKLSQLENASPPIDVTLSGIVMLTKLLLRQNAHSPIEVTLLGIVMPTKLSQYANANLPIEVTLLGITYSVNPAGANANNSPSTTRQRLSLDANLP